MADETQNEAPIVAAAVADASAAQAQAAVAIAEIDAGARVEVETLAQETAQASIDADTQRATAVTREEIEWLTAQANTTRENLSSLSQRIETTETEIRSSLSQIMERLTPPPLPEIVVEEVTEPAAAQSADADAQREAAQAAKPQGRARHRLI